MLIFVVLVAVGKGFTDSTEALSENLSHYIAVVGGDKKCNVTGMYITDFIKIEYQPEDQKPEDQKANPREGLQIEKLVRSFDRGLLTIKYRNSEDDGPGKVTFERYEKIRSISVAGRADWPRQKVLKAGERLQTCHLWHFGGWSD